VEALALKQNKIKMDSRLRGNDDPGSYPLLRRRSATPRDQPNSANIAAITLR
jgi:hypothetical protein